MWSSGEHDQLVHEPSEQKQPVVKVVVHEDYNWTTSDSDLALLKLSQDVMLNEYVVPACLPKPELLRTLSSVRLSSVSGWGRVTQHGAASMVLMRLQVSPDQIKSN